MRLDRDNLVPAALEIEMQDRRPQRHGGGGGKGHSVTRHAVSGEIDPQLRAKRVLRLKRVMMGALAEHRVERKIPPDGPAAWMIDHEVVRGLHCAQTPAHGTPKHKADARRQQFKRALDWAEAQGLIASHEINNVVYVLLCSRQAGDPDE